MFLTRLQAGRQMKRGSIPGKGNKYIFCLKRHDRLWAVQPPIKSVTKALA
jgi:hypothetical protein